MKDGDPEPVAPQPPDPRDCCHSGCTWCVDDMYQEELEKYREAHRAWLARRRGAGDTGITCIPGHG